MRRREKDVLEDQIKTLKERYEKEYLMEKKKQEDKMEELTRRHQLEMKNFKEKMKIEQDEWKDE